MSEKRVIVRVSPEINTLIREYAEKAEMEVGKAADQLVSTGYNRLLVARNSEAKRRAAAKKAKAKRK